MASTKTSKYISTPESQNFAKVCRLFVELLRDVLWGALTKRILPNDIPDSVRKQKSLLECYGKMTEEQYRKICKPGGEDVSFEDFDIPLLYILLRHLPMNPKIEGSRKDWESDVYPNEKHTRETNDIQRIWIKRNQLFAHAGKASLSKDEFDKIWTDMEAVVERFDRRLSTDLKSEMEIILKDIKFEEEYFEDFKKQKEYDLETRQLAMAAKSEAAEAKKIMTTGFKEIERQIDETDIKVDETSKKVDDVQKDAREKKKDAEQKPNGILQNMLDAFPLKKEELNKCCTHFTSPFGFPLCCKVFSSSKIYLTQKSKFFSRPLKALEVGIKELWETDANKPMFVALAAVWMLNEKEDNSLLDSLHRRIQVQKRLYLSNFDKKMFDTVAANLHLYVSKTFSIDELFKKLNGVYLIHHKQSAWQPEYYAFSHKVIEEAFGRVLALTRPSIAVQYGSIEFLVNNTNTASTTGTNDEMSPMNNRERLKISIAKHDFDNLFQRLMKSLKTLDDEFMAVHHEAFEDSNFLDFFLEKLSGTNELEELIVKKRGFAWGFTRTSFLKEALEQNVPKVELVSRILEAKLLDQIDDQRWVQEQKQYMFSLACRLGSWKLYKLLVQESVTITSDAFIRATSAGNRDIVEDLLQRVDFEQFCSAKDNCLALASQNGFMELVELFTEKGANLDIESPPKNETPLYRAISQKNEDIALFLIYKGADVGKIPMTKTENSCLHIACQLGQTRVVDALLNKRDIQIDIKNKNGVTPLHVALTSKCEKAAKVLIDKGCNISLKSGRLKKTPLHISSEMGLQEITYILLKKGADSMAKDEKGHMPIHYASIYGHKDIVEMLIENSADQAESRSLNHLQKMDINGLAPMHYAANGGRVDVVRSLIKAGADPDLPDMNDRSPLYLASQCGHQHVVTYLLKVENIDVNYKEKNNGFTPLHIATERRHAAVVEKLCQHKDIHVNLSDKIGRTPLHIASANGDKLIMKLLLTFQSDPRCVSENLDTPLHLAKNAVVAAMLLAKDSSVITLKNKDGKSPLEMAIEKGGDIVKVFEDYTLYTSLHMCDNESIVMFAEGNADQLESRLLSHPHKIDRKGRLAEGDINLEELEKEEVKDNHAEIEEETDDLTWEEEKGLPPEILRMDKHAQQLYREALEAGKEKVYNIRLMIVGHLGVGKTSLTKRILGEEVSETPHVSTEGIEVYPRCCKIDLDTNEWIVEGKETNILDNGQRLVNIVSEYVANKSKTSMDDINQEETNSILHLKNIEQDLKRSIQEEGIDVSPTDRAIPEYLHPNKELSNADAMITDTTNRKISLNDADEENSHEKQFSLDPFKFQSGHTDLNDTVSIDDILDSENNAEINDTTSHSDLKDFVTKFKTMTHSEKTFCYVTMLDFAGQFVFYTTHQAFMSWRTIYLLVTDISKSLDDLVEGDTCTMNLNKNMECRIHDYVVYWLNSIHSHSIPTDSSPPCEGSTQRETANDEQTVARTGRCPPVILVATHSDKVPEGEKDKIKNEYFEGVRRILKDRPQRFLLRGSIAISNIGPDADSELLKKKIFELAKKQDYWGEEIPGRWLALEQKLMELKRKGVKIIEYSYLEEINTSSDVKIETPEELEVFLRFEHDLGNIVFFNTEKLRDKVVLDPEWLIAGVRILISPSLHAIEDHPEMHPQWYDFKDTGRLTESLIDHLWVEDENEDFHKNRDHLLHLMEKLSIIAKPVEKDGDVQDQKNHYYWVPCVIYKSAPDHVKNPKPCEGMTRTSTLCFVSKTKFIHVGVFHRLVASFLSKFSPAEEDGEYHLYGGCCEFEIDNRHSLYVALNDYIIHATMFRYSSDGEYPDNRLCSDVRSFISSALADITACITPNSEFDTHVKCDRSSIDSMKGLLSISDGGEIRCKCSQPFHPVKVANLLKFWEQKMDPFEADQIYSGTSDITRHMESQTSLRRALPHGKKYHVFFSYSSLDMPWVKKTVETLEKDHGFVCCEYDRDNTPGTSLLRFASDSIKNAYKTLVVMTRDAFQSGFVAYEIDMAIVQGFNERRTCVVPVFLEDCEIPSHLSILNYIDARDPKSRDIWWPKLLTELETQEPG